MAQQTFNDGDSGLLVQGVVNANANDAETRLTSLESDQHAAVTLNSDDPTQETLNLSGQELQVNLATGSTDGAMSATDKTNLDANTTARHDAITLNSDDATQDLLALSGQEIQVKYQPSEFVKYASSNQSMSGTTIVDFQTSVLTSSDVTETTANSVFRLNTIGRYKVYSNVNIRKANGFFQPDARFNGAIQLDTGGGFADRDESYFEQLEYNANSGEGHASMMCIIDVTVANNDEVRVRLNCSTDTNTATESLGTAIFIEYLGVRS